MKFYGAAEWTRTTMMLPSLAPEASASAISPQPHNPFGIPSKLDWCRGPESNRYDCYQSGDFKSPASASFATPAFMERVMGIEPTWPAWKAGALPLSYTRKNPNGAGEKT